MGGPHCLSGQTSHGKFSKFGSPFKDFFLLRVPYYIGGPEVKGDPNLENYPHSLSSDSWKEAKFPKPPNPKPSKTTLDLYPETLHPLVPRGPKDPEGFDPKPPPKPFKP